MYNKPAGTISMQFPSLPLCAIYPLIITSLPPPSFPPSPSLPPSHPSSLPPSLPFLPSLPSLPLPSLPPSLPIGVYNWEDNLLHLCMKEGLSETALQLLQPQHITGKADYLLQRSSRDSKTAVELAHRQGMARVAEMADILMVSCV